MNRHFRSQVRFSCDGKLTRNRANSNFHPQPAIVILAPIWEKRVTQNARRGETRGLTTRGTIQRHPTHERVAKHEDNSRIHFVISTTSTHALPSYMRRAQSLATAERQKTLTLNHEGICTESFCVNEACRRVYRTIANGLTSACCTRSKETQSSQI